MSISANITTAVLGLAPTAAIAEITVTVYSQPPTSLPITLLSFEAVGSPAGNVLNRTASADDVANRFVVGRSTDGQNWQALDTVLCYPKPFHEMISISSPHSSSKVSLKDIRGLWDQASNPAQDGPGFFFTDKTPGFTARPAHTAAYPLFHSAEEARFG